MAPSAADRNRVKAQLATTRAALAKADIPYPWLDAEILVAHVIDSSRERLHSHPERLRPRRPDPCQPSLHPGGAAAVAAQGAGVRAGGRARRRQRRAGADSHGADAGARRGEARRPSALRVRPSADATHHPPRSGAVALSAVQRAQGHGRARPGGPDPDVTARWPADPPHIARAAERLRAGGVIAFPTDTLYGVGARAADPAAVARLYQVKRRPSEQPMVWLVTDRSQVERFAVVSAAATALMERHWPGPLTLVLPTRIGNDDSTIAVRAPDHEVALELLRALGEPMASSSANPAGQAPPVDADHVIAALGDELDVVLDGGPCVIGQPSTIFDLTGPAPRILRLGAIPWEELNLR